MTDNEGTQDVSRGNEWEVVSLTASAYAAAPGPNKVDSTDDENGLSVNEAGTSDALLMSRHFGVPPRQDENLPLQPVNLEVGGDAGPISVEKCGDENLNIEELISDVYSGIPIFDEKGKLLSVSNTELPGALPVSKDQSFYSSGELSSFRGESTMVEENIVNSEPTEFYNKDLDSGVPNVPVSVDKDSYDESKLPCEAWWKKHATSIYRHAKEANSVWSIFVVAAVTGLVILGQRWQQERWQVLQAKLQLSINNERSISSLGPLSRLRDVIVGSNRQGSITTASNSVER
ncbi:hypothetical protein Leryth_007187 [Lithospermum erythrorhizon]|nr:hypothetical protein Leryth_007187 [Lithospermum erythrorhizon]